jgi:hypothetical protein
MPGGATGYVATCRDPQHPLQRFDRSPFALGVAEALARWKEA